MIINDLPSIIFNAKEDLAELLRQWRSQKKTLAFTNGCFDLIHAGHIYSLIQGAKLGDKLLVGLNSDQSVRRLKGQGRPYQDQLSRAQVLAAIRYVDAVILFDEETPIQLLKYIRPDYWVKGKDYSSEQLEGKDFVESYGGTVYLAELLEGHSTTKIIKKTQINIL